MNIIFRADDLGMCQGVNYGIEKTVKEGVVTCVGMMPNMPDAQHGYALIKDQTHISLGQHTNICLGTPLSDPKLIPSLIDPTTNQFCSSKEIRARTEDLVVFEEAVIEIEAQYQRFVQITGKKPEYFEGHAVMSANFFKALEYVAKQHDLFYCNPLDPTWCEETKIFCRMLPNCIGNPSYDPFAYVLEEGTSFYEEHQKECVMMVFHPGYIDAFLMKHSTLVEARPLEVELLSSQVLKDWIKDNSYTLCNFQTY